VSTVLPQRPFFQIVRDRRTTAPPGVRTEARTATVSSNLTLAEMTARRGPARSGRSRSVISAWTVNAADAIIPTGSGPAVTVLPEPSRLKIVSFATVSATSTERVTYSFIISPNEVSASRTGINYSEIARPGRKPLLRSASLNLQQLTITVMVINEDRSYTSSAQAQVDALESLSRLDYDLSIVYAGVDPAKRWRLTDLRYRSVRRNAANQVSIAEADLTFTEVTTMPAVVPGMPTIKDLPESRNTAANPGATTDTQRGGNQAIIDRIIAAGPAPNNPGTSGGGSP